MSLKEKAIPWNVDTNETYLVIKWSDVAATVKKLKERRTYISAVLEPCPKCKSSTILLFDNNEFGKKNKSLCKDCTYDEVFGK